MTTESHPSVPRPRRAKGSAAPPWPSVLRVVAAAAAATLGGSATHAFCLTSGDARKISSTVVSGADYRRTETCTAAWHQKRHRAQRAASPLDMRLGVTSSVIETVVKGVLNLALANPRQAAVECRINSSARELVRGHLEQAEVDG